MKNSLKKLITIKIILLIILLNFSLIDFNKVEAAINSEINYQGRLLDGLGDPVTDTTYSIEFNLYDTAVGGTPIWTETQSSVQTSNGLFSVMLGSVASLSDVDFNQTLYLGVNVEADGEMTPRKVLGSVPTAFESDKLDGVSSEQFLRNDAVNATSSSGTFFTLVQNGAGKLMELFDSGNNSLFTVDSNGKVGVGTTTPTEILSVVGNAFVSGDITSSIITATSTTATSTLPNLITTNVSISGSLYDGASSSGTSGYVLQTTGTGIEWVATSSLGITGGSGSSVWTESGSDAYFSTGRIGIGLSNPSERLDVSGNVKISGNLNTYGDFSSGRTYIEQVGSGLTFTQAGQPSFAKLSSTVVAYINSSQDLLSTYTWNGSSWSLTGSTLSVTVGTASITALNSTTIALVDNTNDQLRTYTWNGSTWSQTGSGLSLTAFNGNPNVTAINSTDIAYVDSTADTLYTYRWNGSTWSQVGSGLSVVGNIGSPSIDMMPGTSMLAMADGTLDTITSYIWSGSAWSVTGNSLSVSGVAGPSITAMNTTDIVMADGTTDEITMYRWDGTNWRDFGENHVLASGASNPEVVTLTGTEFAYTDTGLDTLTTFTISDSTSFTSTNRSLGIGTAAPGASLDVRGVDGITPLSIASSTGTNLLTLTQDGYLGIGTASPQKALHVSISTDDAPVRFQDANGYCEINPTSTTWTCTSDERLKENILDIASSTPDLYERMMKLRPVTFEWKTDETNTQRVGFIAQEVEVIFPEFVQTDDETGLKTVSYGSFITYIIAVFQDLSKKVDLIAEQVSALTGNGFSAVEGVITKLTIGSREKPTGITLFDQSTGDPYCVSVRDGDMVTKFGECSLDEQAHEDSNENVSSLVISDVDEETNTVEITENSQESNGNSSVVVEIEENNEQDIDFPEETVEEVDDTPTIPEEESIQVETNQSSGSVELPIE